jgi:hypothetical protein
MDEYVAPTDPARATEAEAIIERVAALKPDHEYETNGLTWAVAAFAVGLTDIVKETEAERDRLRERVESERRHRLRAVDEEVRALAERDRLRAVVAEVVFHIGPVTPADLPRDAASGDGIVPYEQVPRLVDQVVAERDRLRADLDVSTADIDRYVDALRAILSCVSRESGTLAGRLWLIADQALDVSPTMGDVVREAAEYANSGVDPTSPTYDPDQYGTSDMGD